MHPAHAEQQLLANANAVVAAVQARGQRAILRPVAFHIGIEQDEGVPADGELPDTGDDRARPGLDSDGDLVAARIFRAFQREKRAVDVAIVLLLIAVQVEALREVTLAVVEAHTDERDAEV